MTTQPELPFDSFVGVGEPVPVAPEVPAETPEVPDEVPDVVADVAPVTEEAPATPAPAPVKSCLQELVGDRATATAATRA